MADKELSPFHIRKFPVDIRLKLKGIALKQEKTLNEVAIKALTEYAEREGGK
jgi:hypothetical protein